eukprot:gnl/MRDRNA2_/MRDRNA2_17191_c0_seq1.p1 gnl/MRDRNA2_/MRDRNA2_17191_c0~~gnl/MRDRNA2_/MRDRNA2_17191_c0_seq1.p1  ORF type:complete len:366 (+),score=43.03 gnl/MRDRNA2_/MRDRNA2_17191_c0_seq1:113-1099(+)
MTLNMQYFASYPKDEQVGRARLVEITRGAYAPDAICVQEGISDRDVLTPVGYELIVCAGHRRIAQTVHDMVYGDAPTLKKCDAAVHNKFLCNQIYMRRGSSWKVLDSGAVKVSSDLELVGSEARVNGILASRSMVWVKVRKAQSGPCVYIMCTHITGGRFEDQYFVQQLAQERYQQSERILQFYNSRSNPRDDDVGILVGDFNATQKYTLDGPMHGYFKTGIQASPGVQKDAASFGYDSQQLNDHFKRYMTSPFEAVHNFGWKFAYNEEQVGATSGFGHLIDHMAMSRAVKVISAEVIYLTNQMFTKTKDTDIVLTDHNAVKTVFGIK